jgi:hypothetical protein
LNQTLLWEAPAASGKPDSGAVQPRRRTIVYRTNAIEALNPKRRRVARTHGHIPNDDAAMKLQHIILDHMRENWKRALRAFMGRQLNLPLVKGLLSSDLCSVDGTLIDARASIKCLVRQDGAGEPPAARGTASATSATVTHKASAGSRPSAGLQNSSSGASPRPRTSSHFISATC